MIKTYSHIKTRQQIFRNVLETLRKYKNSIANTINHNIVPRTTPNKTNPATPRPWFFWQVWKCRHYSRYHSTCLEGSKSLDLPYCSRTGHDVHPLIPYRFCKADSREEFWTNQSVEIYFHNSDKWGTILSFLSWNSIEKW